MSYAKARSRLANLLIRAGYNKTKSLRAVKYPYVDAVQFRHNRFFYGEYTESIKRYEWGEGFKEISSEDGFEVIGDKQYNMLGEVTEGLAFLQIDQRDVDRWRELYLEAYGLNGVWYYSYALKAVIKYRHLYPKNEIVDSVKTIGGEKSGIAEIAGEYGLQQGKIPLPADGWEKIEIDEESSEETGENDKSSNNSKK